MSVFICVPRTFEQFKDIVDQEYLVHNESKTMNIAINTVDGMIKDMDADSLPVEFVAYVNGTGESHGERLDILYEAWCKVLTLWVTGKAIGAPSLVLIAETFGFKSKKEFVDAVINEYGYAVNSVTMSQATRIINNAIALCNGDYSTVPGIEAYLFYTGTNRSKVAEFTYDALGEALFLIDLIKPKQKEG